jgi:hypothetical protein
VGALDWGEPHAGDAPAAIGRLDTAIDAQLPGRDLRRPSADATRQNLGQRRRSSFGVRSRCSLRFVHATRSSTSSSAASSFWKHHPDVLGHVTVAQARLRGLAETNNAKFLCHRTRGAGNAGRRRRKSNGGNRDCVRRRVPFVPTASPKSPSFRRGGTARAPVRYVRSRSRVEVGARIQRS